MSGAVGIQSAPNISGALKKRGYIEFNQTHFFVSGIAKPC